MNFDDLTIGQAKELAKMFGSAEKPVAPYVHERMIGRYVIVRTYSAGVHCGTLKAHTGREVVLERTRRIWSWSGAFTLSAIAVNGLSDSSKLSIETPEIMLTEAIEVILCSEEAAAQLRSLNAHDPN